MALATGTALALAGTLAGAGMQAYNTNRTAKKQDQNAAAGIRDQSRIQQKADAKVGEEVDRMAKSRPDDERAARMADYMATLANKRGKTDAGLENIALGDAFNAAGAGAKGQLAATGTRTADMMAGIDAAGLQRQGEAANFGRLASEIGLVGRESSGQRFLTELRGRSIRRNPWLDAGGSALQGLGKGFAGGTGAAGQGMSQTDLLTVMMGGNPGGPR